ncbi:MAG: urea ABC transporter permease subunit UrtB [Pseudomonadota bacterium]
MRFIFAFALLILLAPVSGGSALGQDSVSSAPLQELLQANSKQVERPSRKNVQGFIDTLLSSDVPQSTDFLTRWQAKQVWLRKDDGLFFYGPDARGEIELTDIDSGEVVGTFVSRDLKQVKPNSGVRGVIATALVQFQLSDPDLAKRQAAIRSIERNSDESQLQPLRASIADEPDAALKFRKERLERLLTIRFGETDAERITAIEGFEGDTRIDVRAALNPLLTTRRQVAAELPDDINLAQRLRVGADIEAGAAYTMLVSADLAPERISDDARDATLVAQANDGAVEGVPLSTLDSNQARDEAYQLLVDAGKAVPFVTAQERETLLNEHVFYEAYLEPSSAVTSAAVSTLNSINRSVGVAQTADLALDALSLASIYFLAAIGLAITFGVMGVINMAHGEFIMMGAYTGYVVQLFITDYTASLVVALPLAFAVTFAAGVAMERLVIRHLMHRPLETLLATFGISIALQQLAKNIFGTQARPLTAPGWLDGSLVFNDIVSISYIRIAIFVLAVVFFLVLLFILNRTRLGLEVRAVTQNPSMASSMGINPDRINMLTFGLGSGIAGIAGVAIGLFAQVTSELGSNYIVQSFMTVVVGGVGNIFGTLAGAGMIGSLQKVIEFFNPSNTLAAQTYMIIFIIIFIQFRPKGIIALRGRAAGD